MSCTFHTQCWQRQLWQRWRAYPTSHPSSLNITARGAFVGPTPRKKEREPTYRELVHEKRDIVKYLQEDGRKTEINLPVATPPKGLKKAPYRVQLKEDRKYLRELKKKVEDSEQAILERNDKWELTIGLEVHAQLNTERKLFSVSEAQNSSPNTQVAPFDLALPGTQPMFQKATLIPAIRAALVFGCEVKKESRFDRKHYFYHDQPNGYQITQYYHPYAINGHLDLKVDGDGDSSEKTTRIRIKQMQLEQDTAKSTLSSKNLSLLDFNRVGTPLIEIITEPDLHSAAEAAACVRSIQSTLQAVNAVTSGMEIGGLRCDVNVSIALRTDRGRHLGQRVEIKNLNTLQTITAAVEAEKLRQIEILEAGGTVEGETRAWALGQRKSRRLRGKEGVVDYRYMPDADIPPLLIKEELIQHLQSTLPPLPAEILASLTAAGLTLKDAKTLLALDSGERLDYFDQVCEAWTSISAAVENREKIVANWMLHELGSLLSSANLPITFTSSLITPADLAKILHAVHVTENITRKSAREILSAIFRRSSNSNDDQKKTAAEEDVEVSIAAKEIREMSSEEYAVLAEKVIAANQKIVNEIVGRGKERKVVWLVGQMMKDKEVGRNVVPQIAEEKLRKLLGLGPKL